MSKNDQTILSIEPFQNQKSAESQKLYFY